jgi:hypothetical protein
MDAIGVDLPCQLRIIIDDQGYVMLMTQFAQGQGLLTALILVVTFVPVLDDPGPAVDSLLYLCEQLCRGLVGGDDIEAL